MRKGYGLPVTKTVRFAVDAGQNLEHDAPGFSVECAGWLITQKNLRLFHDRSRDGDSLLLTPGQLRGEVVTSLCEPNPIERIVRRHGFCRNVRDQRHILARG